MAKICLRLTEPTLREDLAVLDRYRGQVDLAELRIDCLDEEECFSIRHFPERAGVPVILSCRRKADGGKYAEGEGTRVVLLAKGLAFPEVEPSKNFAFIDLEEDLRVPSIEETARTFGTTILRSIIQADGVPTDLVRRVERARREGEIVRLGAMPRSSAEVLAFHNELEGLGDFPRVVIGAGPWAAHFNILAERYGSSVCYASAANSKDTAGLFDPATLIETYRFRGIKPDTRAYGIIGDPLAGTKSPEIHNRAYSRTGVDAVYIPFRVDVVERFMRLAEQIPLAGFSVTVPHKEAIIPYLTERSAEVESIGACNTAVRTAGGWAGHNTDFSGFSRAALSFLGVKRMNRVRASLVGAGGAAQAIALALKMMGAKVCVFNRSPLKAKRLAERHGFDWACLDAAGSQKMRKYRDFIVQTTSAGMAPLEEEDPLALYDFQGDEAVMDIIYKPQETRMLARAREAGCRTLNGFPMLHEQAKDQFLLFTGKEFPPEK